jgi:hypothetical protein
MENNERILITELKENKEIDPKKYSILLLRRLQSKEYIKLIFNTKNEVSSIVKGKRFIDALELYPNKE